MALGDHSLGFDSFIRQRQKGAMLENLKNELLHEAESIDNLESSLAEMAHSLLPSAPVSLGSLGSAFDVITCEGCKLFSSVAKGILDLKSVRRALTLLGYGACDLFLKYALDWTPKACPGIINQ